MFKHLLVPLDGSHLAEAALPAAAYLAECLNADVTLIHVIEENAPIQVHGDRHLTDSDEAYAYLAGLAAKVFPPTIKVDQHVHTDEVKDVAQSIVAHAGEFKPDLIILCSHGRGGLHDFLVGSIAQQVIGQGSTPVLLIHPREDGKNEFALHSMLFPMDGKPGHEQGLEVAAELAKVCSASLTLYHVVPTLGTLAGENAATGRMLPGTMSAFLDINEESAARFLQSLVDKVRDEKLSVNIDVGRGDPAPTIADAARDQGIDLIVLGTHGKVGTKAFWSGSVAPKLSTLTTIPILFVPVD